MAPATPPTVWTVGHSTRSLADFIAVLRSAGIRTLADVRRYPGSRRLPHFGAAQLAAGLADAGISYVPMPGLGGRRRPRPDSPNTAWRLAAFRAYADYMETAEFDQELHRLKTLLARQPTAIMCAERLWWQCHRGLIADRLKADGVEVIHILDVGKTQPHPYTSAARIVDGRLSYRGQETLF